MADDNAGNDTTFLTGTGGTLVRTTACPICRALTDDPVAHNRHHRTATEPPTVELAVSRWTDRPALALAAAATLLAGIALIVALAT